MPSLTAAPALAQSHLASHIRVLNLHVAWLAHLEQAKLHRMAGRVYALGRQPKIAPSGGSCSEPHCPLVYHGGAVQHSPHVYMLLWGPAWQTDSGEAASASYLSGLCDGLGVQPQDDWSTTTSQYGDGSGNPSFSATVCKGTFNDTSTPPSSVTQAQLAAEADAFASSQGITDLTDAQIVVATESGICAPRFVVCGGNDCAWHSYSNEPYTSLPYQLDAGGSCGEDFRGGIHDGFSIVEGHEYAETLTDPYLSAWWDDVNGQEIGDKCAWSSLSADVSLSTGSFAMQPLWSNSAGGCVMSTASTKTVSVTMSGTAGSTSKVTSSPAGISCPGTCSASFAGGTSVTLTATPASGGVFTGWAGPCYGMASTICTLALTANTTVSASFTASATLHQQTSAAYSGSWLTSNCTCYSGGTDKKTTTGGASATFKFTGNLVQFVSEKGSSRGSFKVYINGVYQTTVSTHLTTASQNAVIVWQRTFTSVGSRTLKIVNLATSGHPRIDVDAFVVGN
jgi:serine protease